VATVPLAREVVTPESGTAPASVALSGLLPDETRFPSPHAAAASRAIESRVAEASAFTMGPG